MNWLDYTILAIMVLGILSGIRKGLLGSISNIVCIVASIFAAKSFYKRVSLFLMQNTPIEEKLTKFLIEKDYAKNLIPIIETDNAVFTFSQSFTYDLNTFLSILIINAASILLVYIAARFILSLLEGYLSSIMQIPGLKEINRLGGGLIGLAKSVIILMLIFTFIMPVSAMEVLTPINEGIQKSIIAKYFYSYNFILGWIWSAALDLINN